MNTNTQLQKLSVEALENVDINKFMPRSNFNELVEIVRKLHGKHTIAFCNLMVRHFSAGNPVARRIWERILEKLLKDFEKPWFH